MRVKLVKRAALVVCLAALTMSACGSDDSDSGDDQSDASAQLRVHEEFVDQATATCGKAQEDSDKLNQELGEPGLAAAEAAPLLEDLAGLTDDLASDLQTLEAASDDSADLETLLGLLEDATANVKEIAAAVQEGDQETAVSVRDEVNASGEEIDRVTTDLHLTACTGITKMPAIPEEPEADAPAPETAAPADDGTSGETADLPPCSEGPPPCRAPDGSVVEP